MAKIQPNLHCYEIQFEHYGEEYCLDVTTERNSYSQEDHSGRYNQVDVDVRAIDHAASSSNEDDSFSFCDTDDFAELPDEGTEKWNDLLKRIVTEIEEIEGHEDTCAAFIETEGVLKQSYSKYFWAL